ncbi:MAG: hypothetical protein AAGJ28_04720 [Pseudomonadota bacterium]
MQKVIGATLVAVATLTGTAALATGDNPLQEREYERSFKAQKHSQPAASASSANVASKADTRTDRGDRFDRLDVSQRLEDWLRSTQARPAGR